MANEAAKKRVIKNKETMDKQLLILLASNASAAAASASHPRAQR